MWEDRDGSEILKRLHGYSRTAVGWRELAIMGTWYATGSRGVDGYGGSRPILAEALWRQSALLRWGQVTSEGDAWLPLGADPSMPPEQFAELAASGDVTTRILVASNPGTPPDLLVALAGDDDLVVRARCWANPSTPIEAWDARWPLVETVPRQAATRRWNDPVDPQANEADVRAAVASSGATPLGILRRMERDRDEYVVECVRANDQLAAPTRPPKGRRHWYGPLVPHYMRVRREGAPFRIDFFEPDFAGFPTVRLSDEQGWSEIEYEETRIDGWPRDTFIKAVDKVLAGETPVLTSCLSTYLDLVYWTFEQLSDGTIHLTMGMDPSGPFMFETTQSPEAFDAALGRGPSTDPDSPTGPSAGPASALGDAPSPEREDSIEVVHETYWQLWRADREELAEYQGHVGPLEDFVPAEGRFFNAPTSRDWSAWGWEPTKGRGGVE